MLERWGSVAWWGITDLIVEPLVSSCQVQLWWIFGSWIYSFASKYAKFFTFWLKHLYSCYLRLKWGLEGNLQKWCSTPLISSLCLVSKLWLNPSYMWLNPLPLNSVAKAAILDFLHVTFPLKILYMLLPQHNCTICYKQHQCSVLEAVDYDEHEDN